MRKVFTLTLLNNFSCLGSDCPRSCCGGGWRIDIDQKTLKLWESIDDEQDRQWIFDGVRQIVDITQFRLQTNDDCIFLNEQKLCSIQCKFDHNFLPKGCREYPRIRHETPHRHYKTATFSCPEIVKLYFTNPADTDIYTIDYSSKPSDLVFRESNEYYLILTELDKLLKAILLKHEHPPGVRLFLLSIIYSQSVKNLKANTLTLEQIEQTRLNLSRNLQEIHEANTNKQLMPDPVTAGSFWKAIYELCLTRNINPAFLEPEHELLTKSLLASNGSFEGFINIYEILSLYKIKARETLKSQFNQFLEKYLLAYFTVAGFPITFRKETLDVMLIQCLAGLCVLQFMIWCRTQNGKSLTQPDIEAMIVEIHRRIVHSKAIAEYIRKDEHMRQIEKYCACFLDLF